MQPNNQQPQPQQQPQQQPQPQPQFPQPNNPMSYLDQIAPNTVGKWDFLNKKSLKIGLVLIIIAIIILAISSIPKTTSPVTRLAAKLVATKTVTEDASPKLKSTKLRSINSNLKIYLTNTIRDIGPLLLKNKVDINSLDPEAVSAESTTSMMARLADAKLNAVYDSTYAREMTYQLSTIIAVINQVYNSSSDTSLKAFLEKSRVNLEPTQKAFADYDVDNG